MRKNKKVKKSAPEQQMAKHEGENRIKEALTYKKVTKIGNVGTLALESYVNGKIKWEKNSKISRK
jgi:hypothetical protein